MSNGTTITLPTGTPISDSLQRHIDEALSKIPSGKSGHVTAAIATTGVRVTGGYRRGPVAVGGYAGLLWGGRWEAGAQVGVTW